MTLLASAVLVNLAGVMFESNRCVTDAPGSWFGAAQLTYCGASSHVPFQVPIGLLLHPGSYAKRSTGMWTLAHLRFPHWCACPQRDGVTVFTLLVIFASISYCE